jgi:hypothetical protein
MRLDLVERHVGTGRRDRRNDLEVPGDRHVAVLAMPSAAVPAGPMIE